MRDLYFPPPILMIWYKYSLRLSFKQRFRQYLFFIALSVKNQILLINFMLRS